LQMAHELENAQTEIESMRKDAEDKLEQMENQLLRPVQLRAATAVRGYASEHNLKIVLDAAVLQDGLFYVHDTADITTEIIRRIATDLNKPSDGVELAESASDRVIRRAWQGANFTVPAPTVLPELPAWKPVKLARQP